MYLDSHYVDEEGIVRVVKMGMVWYLGVGGGYCYRDDELMMLVWDRFIRDLKEEMDLGEYTDYMLNT